MNSLKTRCQCLWGAESKPYLFTQINPKNSIDISAVYSLLLKVFYALNRATGSRLSLNRISTYLLHRVSSEKQCDLPSSALFFGRDDKILQTRIHYTLGPVRLLESAYRRCCDSLLQAASKNANFNHEETVNADSHLGTPFCPTPRTVRKIVQELQDAVRYSAKSSLLHRHNIFTLYTAMLIAFGTGFRAIKDPSFSEVEIDFDFGIGVLADKGEKAYRSRFVYLAPVVLEQITHYRRHIQVVYSELGVSNPSLFNLIKQLDFEGLPLNLFWLQDEEQPLEILAPKTLRPLLDSKFNYSVRLNANRHYLKFHLLMDGCSPELIEAQLGHWENGQEPWSIMSNLDPLDFVQQMSQHLPGILDKDGWRAVPGLGA